MASSIHDGVTSRSTPGIEAKIHPQQSPPMASSMHDEGLQLHAQLYEFMPQPHHHQQDKMGQKLGFQHSQIMIFQSSLHISCATFFLENSPMQCYTTFVS